MKRSQACLALLAFLALGGCSESSSDAAGTSGKPAFARLSDSFLSDYRASLAGPVTTKSIDAGGEWLGVLFCPSGAFPVSLDIKQAAEQVTAVASIAPAIGDARRKTPFHAEHDGRSGSGNYDAKSQSLAITVEANPEMDRRKARGLHMAMLLEPENGQRALLAVTETSGARSQRACSDGIAARGDAADQLGALIDRIATLKADRRPVTQGQCPPEYRDWLAGMSTDGKLPFDNEAFTTAFGKPYLALDAESLLQASALISGSCANSDDRRQRVQLLRIGGYLRDHRSLQSSLHTSWRDAIWSTWRDWVGAEIARGVGFDLASAVALRTIPHRFGLGRHPTAREFDGQIAELVEKSQIDDRDLQFATRLEDARDDFRALLDLHLQAGGRGDIDMGMVRTALTYYLGNAAKHYAEKATSVPSAAFMSAWMTQHAANAPCPAATSAACVQTAEHFGERLDTLAEALADTLAADFAKHARRDDDIAKLAELVAFERRVGATYGTLLNHSAFEDGNAHRTDTRRELQDDLQDNLLALAEVADTAPALRTIESTYFVDDDFAADEAGPVREAIATRQSNTRPFTKLPRGDYFNALYNRDFAALRALDQRYLRGIRPLMAFGTQQAIALGPLIDAISGGRRGSAAGELRRGLDNLTVLYAVLGTYLLEFQDVYADCLKPGAVTVQISERTDLVRRDGFGNVVERHEGWTNLDYYKVNPEFRGHFQALFDAAKGTAQARLLDLFINDAQVATLRSATRELMRSHACDSAQVKQLEAGFIAYDRELKRRVRGR